MIGKKWKNSPTISYAITVYNEDASLSLLLRRIYEYIEPGDEVVILDDYSDNPDTLSILSEQDNVFRHRLGDNYASQKNYLNSKCKCNYILQLDADELPTRKILIKIPTLLTHNPTVDLFWIPRQNYYTGITQEHMNRWKWRLNQGRINYPDYQGRLYKNKPEIKWHRRVHEHIICTNYTRLPTNTGLDIIHRNPVEKQIQSNLRYLKYFSKNEVNGR